MNYYLKELYAEAKHAGSKARLDAEKIMLEAGYQPFSLNNDSNPITLTKNDVLVLQFPLLWHSLKKQILTRFLKNRTFKAYLLIHDIESLRNKNIKSFTDFKYSIIHYLQNKTVLEKVDGINVAVIKIPSFYLGLTEDVKKLLTEMQSKNASALIVDLRENGGGALTEAVGLSGLFISDGPVVQVRDAYQRIRVHEDPDNAQQYSGPLLVMINRFSASASEIFAAAMQDYNRGIIIGQNTYGKGTVQQSRSLNFVYD